MSDLPFSYEAWRARAQEHASWLRRFDTRHLDAWEHRLRNDPEAAICEACVANLLVEQCDDVVPNEDPSGGGPDFFFEVASVSYLAEVTCLSIEKVSKATRLPSLFPLDRGEWCGFRRPLTASILKKATKKASQLGGQPHPGILFVGTLHGRASAKYFSRRQTELILTSIPHLSGWYDEEQGEIADIHHATDLRVSSFVRAGAGALVEDARRSISAIVGCGFGIVPWQMRGAMHPNPARPIERWPLGVEVCRLSPSYRDGDFEVHWEEPTRRINPGT